MPYEFLKLDPVDLKLALWIYQKHPKAIRSFLEYMVGYEYRDKGIEVDVDKLDQELRAIQTSTHQTLV